MPTPSQHTRLSLEGRLDEHARTAWPQLKRLNIRHRGAFAYVEVELAGGERGKLMRLRYTGTVARWGFALYPASHDRCEDAILLSGSFPRKPWTAPVASPSPPRDIWVKSLELVWRRVPLVKRWAEVHRACGQWG